MNPGIVLVLVVFAAHTISIFQGATLGQAGTILQLMLYTDLPG